MATQKLRQNLRFSHMGRARYKRQSALQYQWGTSDFNVKASDFFTQKQDGEESASSSTTGEISAVRSSMDGSRSNGSGGFNIENSPLFYSWEKGRYKSSSGAVPTNITLPAGQDNNATANSKGNATNTSLSKFTGLHLQALTTDTCGRTRGAKSPGYTTAVVNKMGESAITMKTQADSAIAYSGEGSKNILPTEQEAAAHNASNIDAQQNIDKDDIGYSVYTTFHNNQWVHAGLNTTCAGGDRVLVIAQSEGGTMYDFANDPEDAIYVRTEGNSSISGNTYHVHQAPHKNTTGTDDWVAIYSVVVGSSGGGQVVLVNPWHSSTQRYIYHVFVIKGPNTHISVTSGFTKYTQPQNTVVDSFTDASHIGANASLIGYQPQSFHISVSTSPFANNGFNVSHPSLSTGDGYDTTFHSGASTSQQGAFFTTICNYTGRLESSVGKFGNNYNWAGYSPALGRLGPRQDYRQVTIAGYRY